MWRQDTRLVVPLNGLSSTEDVKISSGLMVAPLDGPSTTKDDIGLRLLMCDQVRS